MIWLKQLLSRRRLYNDLSDEMHQHLEEKIDELVSTGISKKETTAAARRQFGSAVFLPVLSEREACCWRVSASTACSATA